jgi:hypothetical protein
MITIESAYGRYFSDFRGQETALKKVLERLPSEYLLEIKPLKFSPTRVWWNVFTYSDLLKLKEAIELLDYSSTEEECEENVAIPASSSSLQEVLAHVCQKWGLQPDKCEILNFNKTHMLVRLPLDAPPGWPKILKVNLKTRKASPAVQEGA